MADNQSNVGGEADGSGSGDGEGGAFTQADLDRAVKEALAAAKGEHDKAFSELWEEAKAAKKKLQAMGDVDLNEYKKLKAEAEEAERRKAEAEGDFKKLEEQLKANHLKELEAKDAEITKVRNALEKRLVQAELTKAIAAAKGDADLLLPHAERFVKVKETDEDFVAYVVNEDGSPALRDGQGTPMDFDALVKEHLKKKYPRAFDGTGSSGGGAPRSADGVPGSAGPISDAGDDAEFLANLNRYANQPMMGGEGGEE